MNAAQAQLEGLRRFVNVKSYDEPLTVKPIEVGDTVYITHTKIEMGDVAFTRSVFGEVLGINDEAILVKGQTDRYPCAYYLKLTEIPSNTLLFRDGKAYLTIYSKETL
jgi:hypothetical protein